MLILTGLGRRFLVTAGLSTAALLLTTTAAFGQEKQHTEGKSDLALRSEARVDPATLGMSLEIPLGGAPGRAGTSVPVTVRYSSKQWRMKYITPRYGRECAGRGHYNAVRCRLQSHLNQQL